MYLEKERKRIAALEHEKKRLHQDLDVKHFDIFFANRFQY